MVFLLTFCGGPRLASGEAGKCHLSGQPVSTLTSIPVGGGENGYFYTRLGIRSGTWRGDQTRGVSGSLPAMPGNSEATQSEPEEREGNRAPNQSLGCPSFKGWSQEHPELYP